MRYSKYITGLAFCAMGMATMSSCSNDWIDQSPSNGIDAEKAIKTTEDLNTARIGMYAALKGNSNMTDYYGRNFLQYGEVRGEDVQYNYKYGSSRGEFYYYMQYTNPSDFTQDNAIWQSPLIVIGRANRIIEASNISDAEANASTIADYKAEARVARALSTFDLTRVYGKPYLQDNGASWGAPIDTTSLEYNAQVLRSSVADCYTQIIKDLTNALNSGALSKGTSSSDAAYFNYWFAEGLLSRVYLTKGDYANALKYAEDVIKKSPYKLWTRDQYVKAWYNDDKARYNEIMFEFAVTDNSDWVDREGYAYGLCENSDAAGASSGYGDLVITKTLSDSLLSDPKDIRNDVVVKATASAEVKKSLYGGRAVYIHKFPGVSTSTPVDARYANIPLMRLSEMYLNAAEAAFDLGEKETAANYLNAIISNRTTDESKLVTASNITAERIYMERRKELFGEGHRYFDALRRGEKIVRYTSSANRGWHGILSSDAQVIDTWNSKKELPLIPEYEVDANPNIQQNPLY